ncbi:MAG: tRNA lysidine(34) synthetase TilS [Gammaproteobacteria bacterium]|nr:tRNA lysidine(34) synthetase TilS [Gammaproteobacteria bacterium]MCY4226188.1 tRNA lysidine(34) synthetase TilS [Gammaproteobacteria bacterium]
MNFSPEVLERILYTDLGILKDQKIIVAYSGGCDSQALLHGMSILAGNDQAMVLVAAHYDHGLEKNSKQWIEACRQWAEQFQVEFISSSAGNILKSKKNVEARSRDLRYCWLARLAEPGGVVLTAHHADDQAETFLNRMFRGGDVAQLAGIRPERPILYGSPVQLARPLLGFSKNQIQAYAIEKGLDWIDDPSNARNDADRNYLRNRLLPVLYGRGRVTRERLIEASEFCRQISQSYERSLTGQLSKIVECGKRSVLCLADPVNLSKVDLDDESLIFGLMRLWLHQSGRPSPTDRQMKSFLRQVKNSSTRYAELPVEGGQIRCFDRKIYLTRSFDTDIPGSGIVSWDEGIAKLQEIGIALRLVKSDSGLPQSWIIPAARLDFAWHCGHRMIKLSKRPTSSMIRKLQQSHRIPPWERRIIPCIFYRGRIVWVHGVGTTADCDSPDTPGQRLLPCLNQASE